MVKDLPSFVERFIILSKDRGKAPVAAIHPSDTITEEMCNNENKNLIG